MLITLATYSKGHISTAFWVELTLTLQLSIKYCAMDLTKASKKYHEYCRTDKHQSENSLNKKPS